MRLYPNFMFGLISNNPLTVAATALTSTELGDLELVQSPDYVVVTLDPEDKNGNGSEIIYITNHAALATTATVSRGEEGTTAIEHPQSTEWSAAIVRTDMERLDTIEADDWVTAARIADDAVGDAALAANGLDISRFTVGTSDRDTTGKAATADRWTTTRTLTLSGDVTGSVAFNGSGAMALATTVANNSHTHNDSTIDALSASAVTSGVFAAARIPDSAASKITAGAFKSGDYFFPGRLAGIGRSSATGSRDCVWEVALPVEVYRADATVTNGIFIVASDEGGTRNQKARFTVGGDLELEGSVVAESDARLKTNIETIDLAEALARIDQRVVSWDWVDRRRNTKPGIRRGMLAQEVAVTPAADLVRATGLTVVDDEDAGGQLLGLDYAGMLPDLLVVVNALADVHLR